MKTVHWLSVTLLFFLPMLLRAQPVVNLGADTTLCGGSLLLDAGNTGATFLWSTGATTQTITANNSNLYWVDVTDMTGTTRDSINVTINAMPTIVQAAPDTNLCIGMHPIIATSNADVIEWRDSAGMHLGLGDTLLYDVQSTVQLWYQAYNFTPVPTALGVPSTTTAQGYFNSTGRGIQFNVNEDIVRFNSVTVDINVTGASFNATLYLLNSTQTDTLGSYPISYNTSGIYIVPLNTMLTQGSYYLVMSDITGGESRYNVAGVTFPFTIPNFDVTLQAGYPFTHVYNHFCDWQFSRLNTSCASNLDSVVLTGLITPVVNLGADTVLCSDSLLLDATSTGASYQWNTNAMTPTIMATTTGTYKVTVSIGGNCPVEDSINIVVNTQPVITQPAADTSVCIGLYPVVVASTADVIWRDSLSNFIGLGDTLLYNVQNTTKLWYQAYYFMPVSTALGLPVTTAPQGYFNNGGRGIQFNVNEDVVRLNSVTIDINVTGANFGAIIYILNSTQTDTVGSYPISYNTSGTHIVSLGTTLANGSYYLVMSDITGGESRFNATGVSFPYTIPNFDVTLQAGYPFAQVYNHFCDWQFSSLNTSCASGLDSVVLTALATPVVNLGADTVLCSDSLLLDATSAGANYQWNTNAMTPTIMATTTGTYKVTVSLGGNCPVEDSINIVVNTRPAITQRAVDTSVCAGLYPVVVSSIADVVWRDSLGNLVGIGDTLSYNLQNTTKLWYQAYNFTSVPTALGIASSTAPEGYFDNPGRGIHFNVNEDVVRLNSVAVDVTVTGSNFSAIVYLLNSTQTDTLGSYPINYSTSGIHVVSLGTTLVQGSYYLVMSDITGGTSRYNVAGVAFPYTIPNFDVTLQAGYPFAHVYNHFCDWQFSSLNTSCISNIDSVVLTTLPTPVVNLGADTVLCSDSLLLDATYAGASYQWNINAITPTVMATTTGVYKVTVSIGGSCPVEDSIDIIVNTRPVVTQPAVDTSICVGLYPVVASSTADIVWQDSLSNFIGIGDTLSYNVQNTAKLWYQAYNFVPVPATLGLSATAAPEGYFNNVDRGIHFNVNEDVVRLNSVTVDINVTGSNFDATLYLLNSAQTDTIGSYPISYSTSGIYVVSLGTTLVQGSYYLMMSDITGGESRYNVAGVTFPYTIPNFDITLQAGYPFTHVYNHFCDWQFSSLNTSCASNVDSVVLTALPTPVVNLNTDTIVCADTVVIDVSYPGASYSWDGVVGNGGIATITQEGLYKVTATIGSCSVRDSINVYLNPDPVISIVSNDTTTCVSEIPRLATGADVLKWYTDSVGGNYLGEGQPFMYNAQATDTIWAQGQNFSNKNHIQALVDTGIANLSGYIFIDRARGLVFDAHENIRLKNVTMYVGGTNQFIGQIQLWNANNIALDSIYIALPAGQNIVPINFDIPAGQGYKLILTQYSNNTPLYVDYPLNSFPLSTGDYVTIQEGFPFSTVYHFFYQWEVQTLGCPSPRLPSIVNVLPTPDIDLPIDTIICGDSVVLDINNSGALTYNWSTGATTSTVVIDTTSLVSVVGAIGACSDEDSINVFIIEPPSLIVPPNDTVLCEGNATFHASGNAAYYAWYDSLNSTTSFAIGDSITLNVQDSTTLWVEGIGFIPKSRSLGETYSPSNNINFWLDPQGSTVQRRILFTVNSPIILNSFKMYTDTITSGVITIYRAGFPFFSQNVNLNSIGENTVVLDALLEPGNYYIEYNNNAAGKLLTLYPYNSNNLSNISAPELTFSGLLPSTVYHYFFEWKISTPSCATARLPFNVDVPPSPSIEMIADTATCVLSNITLDPIVNNSPSYYYEWSNGSTGDTLNVTTPGYYGVTVTNSGHCSSEQDVFVQFLSTPATPAINDTSICAPQQVDLASAVNDGIMVWYDSSNLGNVVHLTAPYQTYVADTTQFWVDVAPKATTRIGQQAYNNPADPSAYWNVIIANVFDVHEYTILDSVAIYLESAPATIDIVLMDALGNVLNSTTYTSTQARKKMFVPLGFLIPPGQGYQLSFANIGAQFLVDRSALATTTSSAAIATITGTSVAGVDYTCFFDWHFSYAYPSCHSAPDSFDVTVNMPVTLVDSMYTCDSVIVDLTHPNITSYNWSTGATTAMATLYNEGWHTVTISDGASCTVVDSIIIEKPMPVGLTDGNVVCDYILSTNYTTANASFVWNTIDTTGTITIPSIGVYTVTVTTNGGCVLRDTAMISQIIAPPSPTLSNFVDACFKDTLDAGYGGQGMSYLWSTGDTTQTLIVDNSALYSVTITHPLGCSGDDYSVVTIDTLPQASFTVTKSGNSIGINNTSTGGNQAVSYLWNMGDSTTYQIPNPFHTYGDTGCYRITLIVTNACGSDTARAYIGIGRPDSTCFTVGTTTLANVSRDGFDFVIVPNPNTGQFQLQPIGMLEEESQVMLYDLNGRLLHQQLVQHNGMTPIEVVVDNLPDGMYFVRLVNPKQSRTQRVVILRQ